MEKVNIWSDMILTIMKTLMDKIIAFLPNLLGAVVILVIGYIISRIFSFLLSTGLAKAGFNKLSDKVGIGSILSRAKINLRATDIVKKLVFWMIMLTFIVTATETLGLPRISEAIDEFILYLPKVIGAVLVLIIGLFLAHFARDVVRSSAEGIGVEYAKPLGSAVFGVLFIVVISLAISQLEIDTGLLNTVVSIVLAALGVAAALSLGLGTRELASHILAGVYARDLYQVGDDISVADVQGKLESVGTVKTEIRLKNGVLVSVSNASLIDSRVNIKRAE